MNQHSYAQSLSAQLSFRLFLTARQRLSHKIRRQIPMMPARIPSVVSRSFKHSRQLAFSWSCRCPRCGISTFATARLLGRDNHISATFETQCLLDVVFLCEGGGNSRGKPGFLPPLRSPGAGENIWTERLDIDLAGDAFRLINLMIDIHLQPMEKMDLEQISNGLGKLIHSMWKGRPRQNRTGPGAFRTS